MLCSRFKQILFKKNTLNNNVQIRCFINARFVSTRCGVEGFWATFTKNRRELHKMSSVRFIFRDINLTRLWSAWTRNVNVGHVVRRYRRDRNVREVIQCFRQAFLRPRRFLMLSATAACQAKRDDEDKSGKPPSCSLGISDKDLQALISDLEGVDDLVKRTLYCIHCHQRMVITSKKLTCPCKEGVLPDPSPDGWEPYLEAEDVIIWRKEYKLGQGLYAYKVYGRYNDIRAQDYAAVNVDAGYRKRWDTAVAALSVVEKNANGVQDQAVLHWEVLWPRLFANRDYVYIRRHKEYDVSSKSPKVYQEAKPAKPIVKEERESVHSNAKRKSLEAYSPEDTKDTKKTKDTINKVYVIISRSCTHPEVPVTRNAIRVSEYWSHMVVKSLDGVDKTGMEFLLTYYDEPAVGGLPSGVAAWATGRAAPAYLQRMRVAARGYTEYKIQNRQDTPDFTPIRPEAKKVSYEDEEEKADEKLNEEDMESSKTGPEMDGTRDQGTQTEDPPRDKDKGIEDKVKGIEDKVKIIEDKVKFIEDKVKATKNKGVNTRVKAYDVEEIPTPPPPKGEKDDCEIAEDENNNNGGWWRYLYPFYYFV